MGGTISKLNTRTNLTIPRSLKYKLEVIAQKENRSFNNLIITVLSDYVKQREVNDLDYRYDTAVETVEV